MSLKHAVKADFQANVPTIMKVNNKGDLKYFLRNAKNLRILSNFL